MKVTYVIPVGIVQKLPVDCLLGNAIEKLITKNSTSLYVIPEENDEGNEVTPTDAHTDPIELEAENMEGNIEIDEIEMEQNNILQITIYAEFRAETGKDSSLNKFRKSALS